MAEWRLVWLLLACARGHRSSPPRTVAKQHAGRLRWRYHSLPRPGEVTPSRVGPLLHSKPPPQPDSNSAHAAMDRFEDAKLRIKEATDLVALIESYLPLKPRGRGACLVGGCDAGERGGTSRPRPR